MAEPARKLPEEDKPEIRPSLGVIRGGGQGDGLPAGQLRSVDSDPVSSEKLNASESEASLNNPKSRSSSKETASGAGLSLIEGGAASSEAGSNSLFSNEDDDKGSKRKRPKGKLSNLAKHKFLIGVGGGGLAIIAILVLLLILFGSALKLPNITQNIENYEFANVTNEFAKNAANTTDEDLAVEATSDSVYSQLKEKFAGQYQNIRDSTWGKLDDYRPSQVIKKLGQGEDGLTLTYKASAIPGRGDIWTGGSFNGVDYDIEPVSGIANWIPGIRNILQAKNAAVTRGELLTAVNEDMKADEIGTIVRGGVFKTILSETNGSLTGWILNKFAGDNAQQAEDEETTEMEQATANATIAPDDATTSSIKSADEAEETTLEQDAQDPATVQKIINDDGEDVKADAAADAASNPDLLTNVADEGSPLTELAIPLCIIYDGSVQQSGGTIDNQTGEQENAFDQLAAEADQQKNGDVTTTDGTELGTAIGAGNAQVGDITQSIPYQRASGANVNTSDIPSSEAGSDGSYSYSIFDALGLPDSGVEGQVINWVTGHACGALTSTGFALGFGALNIAIGIGSLGTETAAEETAGETAQLTVKQFITNLVDNSIAKLTAKTVETDGVKTIERGALSRAMRFVFKQGLIVGGTFGATELAHLIVAARSGEANSGFAQGSDIVNEADSGANIESGEVCRTQLFCRPLTPAEVTLSENSSTKYVLAENASKPLADRYFALSNPDSLFSHIALELDGSLKMSSVSSILKLGTLIFKPWNLFSSTLGSFAFARAAAAGPVDPNTEDYGNVQFGWTSSEENLASGDSYKPLENQYILDNDANMGGVTGAPTAEDAIAQTYAVCFGYKYNPNGNGDLDPTDAQGNLTPDAASGQPGSLGELFANQDIQRDADGNVLASTADGLCSPDNLGPNNDQFGTEMVFRWRLAMEYDTTISTLTNEQTTE
jgi:hypothetical protein